MARRREVPDLLAGRRVEAVAACYRGRVIPLAEVELADRQTRETRTAASRAHRRPGRYRTPTGPSQCSGRGRRRSVLLNRVRPVVDGHVHPLRGDARRGEDLALLLWLEHPERLLVELHRRRRRTKRSPARAARPSVPPRPSRTRTTRPTGRPSPRKLPPAAVRPRTGGGESERSTGTRPRRREAGSTRATAIRGTIPWSGPHTTSPPAASTTSDDQADAIEVPRLVLIALVRLASPADSGRRPTAPPTPASPRPRPATSC